MESRERPFWQIEWAVPPFSVSVNLNLETFSISENMLGLSCLLLVFDYGVFPQDKKKLYGGVGSGGVVILHKFRESGENPLLFKDICAAAVDEVWGFR